MPVDSVKKRRACDACTKAKAKCLPLRPGADICHRCERLNKECIYGDSLRKRGPKTRSRMKQLEQRVESIVEILTANIQPSEPIPEHISNPVPTQDSRREPATAPQTYVTPEESPRPPLAGTPSAFDPVEARLLQESKAAQLFDEFRHDHPYVFPFVVVDEHIHVADFRRQQPFLFLSIMAAMAYRMPRTQILLGDAFRDEIAARIIGRSHKSLEMLQGLLVHTAYYHFFYRPGIQQLSLMVQLCVAMAQDFGVSKKWRAQHSTCHSFEKSVPGQRAMLGTYYLATSFAHAWRKRNTMHYTKALARSCQALSQDPERPSDVLILPLIHASELMCRINDHFSYDEIGDSDIIGETMIDSSVKNFSAELQRLRDTLPQIARTNMCICVTLDMLEVLIYECSFHDTLWKLSSSDANKMSPARSHLLLRSFNASHKLAITILEAPSASLNHLAFPAWSNWFYSTLLVVKIVIFQRTGSTGFTCIHNAPHAVGDLLPQDYGEMATQTVCTMTSSLSKASLDNTTSTEEQWLISAFEAFLKKLASTSPQLEETSCGSPAKPFLDKVAKLQRGLLMGLKKITAPKASIPTPGTESAAPSCQQAITNETIIDSQIFASDPSQYTAHINFDQTPGDQQVPSYGLPDLVYVDNAASMIATPADDWLWNMVMADGSNMFSL